MAKRGRQNPSKQLLTGGYADSIAIAVIAGIVITIAIIFAVANLGKVSSPTLPNPSPTPTPSSSDSTSPSPTKSPYMSPSPRTPTPSPTAMPVTTGSPDPQPVQ